MNDKHDQQDKHDDPLDRLFAAARRAPVDTSRAELGFETRLMARLREQRAAAIPWFAWTWRLAPVYAAIVIALGIWTWATPDISSNEWTVAFSYDLAEPGLIDLDPVP
jgi:hypothetical protein